MDDFLSPVRKRSEYLPNKSVYEQNEQMRNRSHTTSDLMSSISSMLLVGKQPPTKLHFGPESNPIAKTFADFQLVCDAGPSTVWKLYRAKHKQSKEEAAVFFFQKRQTAKVPSKLGHRNRLTLNDLLKRDVNQLNGLKHPRILTVIHKLEETNDTMAFATEPVMGTLSAVFESSEEQKTNGLPFEAVEIKCGLLQITEALSYLHNSARVIHCNLTPDNVYVTTWGSWKIAGFAFSEHLSPGAATVACFQWSRKISPVMQQDLDFMAPEYQTKKSVSTSSDVFSLGALVCWIYANGKRVIDSKHNPENYGQSLAMLPLHIEALKADLGPSLKDAVTKMLTSDVLVRPTAQLFTLIKHFDDPAVSSLRQLDDLPQKDTVQKVQFLCSTLRDTLYLIPEHLWVSRVLPRLDVEVQNTQELYSAVVRPILYMLEHCDEQHVDQFRPWIGRIIRQCSNKQPMLVGAVLESLHILFSRLSDRLLENKLMDILNSSLRSSIPQLQSSALTGLSKIRDHLSPDIICQNILPGVEHCMKSAPESESNHLQMLSISCLEQLVGAMDPTCLTPLLNMIKLVRVGEPELAVSVAKLYQRLLAAHLHLGITPVMVTTDVLPHLLPTLTNPKYTTKQFDEVIATCRLLLDFVEHQQYIETFRCRAPSVLDRMGVTFVKRYSLGGSTSTGLPQVTITTAQSPYDREMSFMSADGRLCSGDSDSRRSSEDSRMSGDSRRGSCAFPIGALLDFRRGSGDNIRCHSIDATLSQPERRGSWFSGYFRSSIDKTDPLIPFHTPPTIRKHRMSTPNSVPQRRHSYVNLAGNAPGATPKPSSFQNLSHNLACTLWNKLS